MSRVLDMGRGSMHPLKLGASLWVWKDPQDALILHLHKLGASLRGWNNYQDALIFASP